MRRIFLVLVLFIATVSANSVFSQTTSDDIEQLNAKILELQQQIIEIQKRHESEMNALKEQINQLAAEAGEREAKEEIASLRELAKAKAAEVAIPEEKPEETIFEARGLGLQALNPEVSGYRRLSLFFQPGQHK